MTQYNTDKKVDDKAIKTAQQLTCNLPWKLHHQKDGYTIHPDTFTNGMTRAEFDSVLTYCLEVINGQIRPGRKSAQNYASIREGLEELLPEENVFGAGIPRDEVLNSIYAPNRWQ